MCYILERLYTEGQSGLRMVLYRCQKLYNIRQDAAKILIMMLKLKYDIDKGRRVFDHSYDTNLLIWRRIKALVYNFNVDFADYLGPFMFHGQNLEEQAAREIKKYDKMNTGGKVPGSTLEKD